MWQSRLHGKPGYYKGQGSSLNWVDFALVFSFKIQIMLQQSETTCIFIQKYKLCRSSLQMQTSMIFLSILSNETMT